MKKNNEKIMVFATVSGVVLFGVILVVAMVMQTSKNSYPTSEDLDGYHIQYTTVEVYPESTVSEIAQEIITDTDTGKFVTLEQEIKEIQRMNHLDSKCTIRTYEYIAVPYIIEDWFKRDEQNSSSLFF